MTAKNTDFKISWKADVVVTQTDGWTVAKTISGEFSGTIRGYAYTIQPASFSSGKCLND